MIRLMVVDDHPAFRAAVDVMCVVDGGLEVVASVASVREALANLASDPDLVLLDVNVGEIDGMTGARMIRSERPHLPIVLCSTARLSELPPVPDDAGVLFVAKQDLDATVLHEWHGHAGDR